MPDLSPSAVTVLARTTRILRIVIPLTLVSLALSLTTGLVIPHLHATIASERARWFQTTAVVAGPTHLVLTYYPHGVSNDGQPQTVPSVSAHVSWKSADGSSHTAPASLLMGTKTGARVSGWASSSGTTFQLGSPIDTFEPSAVFFLVTDTLLGLIVGLFLLRFVFRRLGLPIPARAADPALAAV